MLKDPALAPAGRRKIDFAASRMPVLAAVTEELARTRPLAGHRIAACLHVTTETANLCRALPAGRRRPGQRADPGRGRRRRPQATIHISRRDLLGGIVGGTEVTSTGVLRATNVLLAGKVLVVVGYGWCGRGLASRARGMGAGWWCARSTR
jgi:adenosylhomocysteinase